MHEEGRRFGIAVEPDGEVSLRAAHGGRTAA
jgi:hypothetical protein